MYDLSLERLTDTTTKYKFSSHGQMIRFSDWISLIQESETFASFFIEMLKASKCEAYFWEVPPVTSDGLEKEFECVLVRSRNLVEIKPDPSPFQAHFSKDEAVISFLNLGRDAQLVVPTPIGAHLCYPHLATFVREAPPSQVLAFWKRVGQEYEQRIHTDPTWLSTAGLGVSWLHVRIDSRPKYYRHQAYKVW